MKTAAERGGWEASVSGMEEAELPPEGDTEPPTSCWLSPQAVSRDSAIINTRHRERARFFITTFLSF